MRDSQRLRNILGGSAGNFVEWFDWFVYAAFALYFSRAFFPDDDQTTQLLNSAMVFGGGFLARPIGAWLMGRYADRAGRRAALTVSVGMMCSGSLLIAVLPAGLGVASTALLVCARVIQGLSMGGEYGASATYLSEMASTRTRGLWSGVYYSTLIAGQLTALLLLILLQATLSEAQLYAWGWRIPFAIGAALALVVFWIRRGIDETSSHKRESDGAADESTGWSLLTRYPKETGIVLVLSAGGGMGFYTYTVYMQKFLVNTSGFDKGVASQIVTAVLVTMMLLMPPMGWLSDRVGRKPVMMFSYGAGALFAVPVLSALATTTDPMQAFLLCLLPVVALTGYSALSGILKAELFPTRVRALGVALPYAISQALFGGNAETAALGFKKAGYEAGYFWLITAVMAAGFVVAALMRDTKHHSLIAAED
ncbi:MAG: MFS transporter [Sinobacteraceae bacterium]|nr:MFS transporter [Nevskiaceae bacterium]MCP5338677.1 MFS transporter [Nevskiaceae bacterium]MCP5473012.1 MFS transporter [Nevskiaceae bacterium]